MLARVMLVLYSRFKSLRILPSTISGYAQVQCLPWMPATVVVTISPVGVVVGSLCCCGLPDDDFTLRFPPPI